MYELETMTLYSLKQINGDGSDIVSPGEILTKRETK